MNERIRELAFKASNGMLSYDGEGEWRLSQKEVEKFAELIVEDIMQELFINGYEDAFDHLNKYFGVEK